ncbi:hypothetical protein [Terriglobus roseus]|uniref:Uncharacterized protein n=1 Tax=Terriglobus roseus TaxID=392734 RepID=A0A1H4N134_9BACT|nr:hypothetical protein [Terriglobus roseus]SEB88797.1 hypothetical protein SAMN05443244_2101 [Terriglobus roseus]
MQPTVATGAPARRAPNFHVIERKPPRPAAILLAIVMAAAVASAVAYGLNHSKAARLADGSPSATRDPDSKPGATPHTAEDDKDDDPSQVDTIVLGDAADAPVPARRSDHVSPVHATIIVHLPRFGAQSGLIPDTPSGRLLYGWLAAFNQGVDTALEKAVPNVAPVDSAVAQMVLRAQTGGFNLLSAREVQPGLLVFRLRDQTPDGNEVLGTLYVRPNSDPPEIASLSLRAVQKAKTPTAMAPVATHLSGK